jgi:hypothetical protein
VKSATTKEQALTLPSDGATLEARIEIQSPTQAVIITHPHPLYGGNMDNPVVTIMAAAYAGQGWSTLRFNFRGTGNSTGQHDEGTGEQGDVQAAIEHLIHKGYQTIDLAGYSFGAWVLAGWSRRRAPHPHRLVLVAPPLAFIDFGAAPIPGLQHVLTGALDDLAPPGPIQTVLPQWAPQARLTIIPGADHFFWNHAQSLQAEMVKAIR